MKPHEGNRNSHEMRNQKVVKTWMTPRQVFTTCRRAPTELFGVPSLPVSPFGWYPGRFFSSCRRALSWSSSGYQPELAEAGIDALASSLISFFFDIASRWLVKIGLPKLASETSEISKNFPRNRKPSSHELRKYRVETTWNTSRETCILQKPSSHELRIHKDKNYSDNVGGLQGSHNVTVTPGQDATSSGGNIIKCCLIRTVLSQKSLLTRTEDTLDVYLFLGR